MTDPLAASLAAVATGSYAAVPIAAAAGALTSIGPCVAPRYLALAAIIDHRRPLVTIAAFTAGIVLAYMTLGVGATLIANVVAQTTLVDTIVAVVLIAFGCRTLLRDPVCCDHAKHGARAGGALTLGAASALVVSPCCTPALAAFAGLGAFDRDPPVAAAYLAAFALGHAAPLLLAGVAGASGVRHLRAIAATPAPAMISGTLTIALGCYYGLLA